MELVYLLQGWFSPAVYLFLIFFCFKYIKSQGREFFVASLILWFLMATAFQVANLDVVRAHVGDPRPIFEILGLVDLILGIVGYWLIVIAWANFTHVSKHSAQDSLSLRQRMALGFKGTALKFSLVYLVVLPTILLVIGLFDFQHGHLVVSLLFTVNYLVLASMFLIMNQNKAARWFAASFLIIGLGSLLRIAAQNFMPEDWFDRVMDMFTSITQMYFLFNLIHLTLLAIGISALSLNYQGLVVTSDSEPSTQVNPLKGNLKLYLGMLYLGVAFFSLTLFFALRYMGSEAVIITLILVGALALLSAQVYFLMILYRLWKHNIQTSHANELNPSLSSAGKAVGFLFIPIFSLYWLFIAFGKLPRDYNALAEKLGGYRVAGGIGVVFGIVSLLSLIPLAGYIFSGLVLLIIGPMFLHQLLVSAKALEQRG